MKRIIRLCTAACFVFQLASCVNTEREIGTSTKDPRETFTPPPADRARVNSSTVLNTVRATHSFSDPKTKDMFTLQLRGPRVLTAKAHLIVTNMKGDTLRHEVLPARALMAQDALADPRAATVRDQEIAILRGMNSFFSDERFTQPAVPPSAEQPAELDTQTWMALREDRNAIGFDYPVDGGNVERRLAYVHKLGRVVVISQ